MPWAAQFRKTCSNNQTVLQVSDGDLELIEDAESEFDAAYEAMVTARAAAEGATQMKDQKREALINAYRPFVGEFQSNPLIPEDVYAELQIPKRGGGGSRGAAITPSNVVASASGTGEITIKFDRNGNPQSAIFTIEHQVGSNWIAVTSGTKTRYKLTGFATGVPAFFRVKATRGNSTSVPSNTVSVWAGEGESFNLNVA